MIPGANPCRGGVGNTGHRPIYVKVRSIGRAQTKNGTLTHKAVGQDNSLYLGKSCGGGWALNNAQ